jgi:hypothetical protein
MKLPKIPKTTPENPYIKFEFNRQGKIKLSAVESGSRGGKRGGFISSKRTEGNTCLPKDLESYIEAFKKRKVKKIEKEIKALQNQLERVKEKYELI